jgi:hypothetical protein
VTFDSTSNYPLILNFGFALIVTEEFEEISICGGDFQYDTVRMVVEFRLRNEAMSVTSCGGEGKRTEGYLGDNCLHSNTLQCTGVLTSLRRSAPGSSASLNHWREPHSDECGFLVLFWQQGDMICRPVTSHYRSKQVEHGKSFDSSDHYPRRPPPPPL